MKENRESLVKRLRNAGWYEGRQLFDIDNITPAQSAYYPKNIIKFIAEFGNLKMENELLVTEKYLINYYIHIIDGLGDIPEGCYTYKINDKIIFEDVNIVDYYHSVLIGTNLYWVADIGRDYHGLFMDKYNNFYVILNINAELQWIGTDVLDAFCFILRLGNQIRLKELDEINLSWVNKGSLDTDYILPINKTLTHNPWS